MHGEEEEGESKQWMEEEISCLCERECGNGWWSAVVKLCDLVEIFSL
jgi:hypothetical protein